MNPGGDLLAIDVRHRLSRIELDVRLAMGRETVALVGPSGAGKTSVLKALAGLMRPDRAHVVYDGRALVDTDRGIDLPADERRVGMMFQDGALFPHMTVERNVAYGLRPRPRGRKERRARVGDLLERFGIEALAHTRPGSASGGERQRVALARVVASSPDILLLDEPLSALDSVTKARVSSELAKWLAELRLPTILVSHDYGDVVGLADRIAVIDGGRIVQIGSAADLMYAPASDFVAAFISTNYFTGSARTSGGLTEITLPDGARFASTTPASGLVAAVVDPWAVQLTTAVDVPDGPNVLRGPVIQLARTGRAVRVTVASRPPLIAELSCAEADTMRLDHGALVSATWRPDAVRLVDARSKRPGVVPKGG